MRQHEFSSCLSRYMSGVQRDREYLFTIVHETGHAFNFLHSFQKGIREANGVLPRPDAMSWMNYPFLYPFGYAFPNGWDGTDNFWSQFEFVFDRDEVHHLRHNDRAEVVPGGASFGAAGHFGERVFSRPSMEHDIELSLWLPSTVEFLQQVEGDVRLKNISQTAVKVPPSLSVTADYFDLVIKRPTDHFPKTYRHFARECVSAGTRELPSGQAVYQEISLSYGRGHWFIDEPGTYEVQAITKLPDGRFLASDVRRVRVLQPDVKSDRVACDFFSNDVGVYFGLDGSRSASLSSARRTLKDIKQRLPKAAISRQFELVNALCDTRIFKDVAARKVHRKDRSKAATRLLKVLGSDNGRAPKEVSSVPNLKVTRALVTAAMGCAADKDLESAKQLILIADAFIRSVGAPEAARSELETVSESISN